MLLERIEESGWEQADLGPRREALLRYALKLTREPAAMRASDLEPLRAVGLADEDILALAELTAYFAFVNRIADGLGVALEDPAP